MDLPEVKSLKFKKGTIVRHESSENFNR